MPDEPLFIPPSQYKIVYATETYSPKDFWPEVWNVITSIVSSIAQAFIKTVTTAAKELAAMLTLDRVVGVGVNYAKQQASTWLTHSVMNLGHQQWLANLLHAMGLDFSDLLRVGKDAIGAGFNQLNIGVMSTLKEVGLLSTAGTQKLGLSIDKHALLLNQTLGVSAGITQRALGDHAALMMKAQGDWTMFTARNYSAEEEKNRAWDAAIFLDTPERIRDRSLIDAQTGPPAMSSTLERLVYDSIWDRVASQAAGLRVLMDNLNGVILTARQVMYAALVGEGPISYEHVGAYGLAAFSTAFTLGITAHAISVTADLVHPLKATGIPQLAAFMADMAGFAAIAKDTWYEDLRNFLGTPYKHYSLRSFRPTLPAAPEVLDLFSQNLVLENDVDKALGYHGFR
ncbi:MAG TPA: hypothetical protein VEG35_03245, partial [Burkholderiales bacterium]|nr:hypothetical protein [Burkholderiales bacterium]